MVYQGKYQIRNNGENIFMRVVQAGVSEMMGEGRTRKRCIEERLACKYRWGAVFLWFYERVSWLVL